MRKMRRDVIQLSILAILGMGVILSLVVPQLSNTQAPTPVVDVSLFLGEVDMAIGSSARLGIEQAAADFGARLRFISPSETQAGQTAAIEREIENGADALIVTPIAPNILAQEPLSCPMVTLQSTVGDGLCVTPDNQTLGAILAQTILDDNPTGAIFIVDNVGTAQGLIDRRESCIATLEAAGLQVMTGQSPILCPATASGIVALDCKTTLALSSYGASIPTYGVGSSSQIAADLERGYLTATVTWSEYAAGYLAVQHALDILNNQTVQSVSLDITTIRGEDLYGTDHQKLLFPVA